MKIENYSDANGFSADAFTFQYNPRVFDDPLDANMTIKNIPYSKTHIAVTNAGIDPKSLVLTGHFSGSSKRTYYNSLAKHTSQAKLKKIYFGTDRFYIGLGRQTKQTNAGGRTNFIDYVTSFVALIGIVFGNTQKTDVYVSSWATGTAANAGPATTYIEKISVLLDSGGSAGDTVIVRDGHNHGIQVTLADYSIGDILTIYLISLASVGTSEIFSSEYWYCYQDSGAGTQVKRITESGKKSMFLTLEPTDDITDITFAGTASVQSYTAYFRDGYYG